MTDEVIDINYCVMQKSAFGEKNKLFENIQIVKPFGIEVRRYLKQKEAAEVVLLKYGKPMSCSDIHRIAIEMGILKPNAKKGSMHTILLSNSKRKNGKFVYKGNEIYGLKSWLNREGASKNSERAFKANDTKKLKKYMVYEKIVNSIKINKECDVIKKPKEILREWDGTRKRIIRNNVVKYFKFFGPGNVLALESHKWLFAKLLPSHDFYIWENDSDVYNSMIEDYGENIKRIFPGDIKYAIDYNYKYAFLDFCGIYKTHEGILFSVRNVLKNTKIIAVTFATRLGIKCNDGLKDDELSEYEDQKSIIRRKLNMIFPNHNVERFYSYKDGTSMITYILMHKDCKYDD